MRRIVVGIQYDGKNFVGFQKQPKGESVQSALEDAIFALSGERVKVVGSGRTDSGVHALCQVAHFDFANDKLSFDNLVRGINVHLNGSVSVLWAKEAPKSFDAQKSAKKKTYQYVCYVSDVKLPLFEDKATHLAKMPNIKDMQQAAKCLVGEHDFSSFCAANSGRENFVRRVLSIEIEQKQVFVPILIFRVCGTGFLYKMVRNIVGTLLEVGSGKRSPKELAQILEAKNRKLAGKTAPAQGLYLASVDYN